MGASALGLCRCQKTTKLLCNLGYRLGDDHRVDSSWPGIQDRPVRDNHRLSFEPAVFPPMLSRHTECPIRFKTESAALQS